jgi:probable phosphoglycerate mutase
MITYLLRHGRTAYSARYRVNGDPGIAVPLDDEGILACRDAREHFPVEIMQMWVTSSFPRARQTGELLRDGTGATTHVEPLLDELDYGRFEGGPFLDYAGWLQEHGPRARPEGARESQHAGIRRMLTGVRAALELPGPRCVVAHGLLLSVLRWKCANPPGTAMPLFFPEASCLEPFPVADVDLREWLEDLLADNDHNLHPQDDAVESRTGVDPVLATFDPLARLEEKDPHA